MAKRLKPSKCRSFSIKSDSPAKISFLINEYSIPTISDEEQKFLGCLLFFSDKSLNCFSYIKKLLIKRLDTLEMCKIRPEFKLDIYKTYISPSLRFILNVHELPKCYLTKLDLAMDNYHKASSKVTKSQ